jgi:hypothetical protein
MTVYLRGDTPDAANRARTVQQAPTDAGPTLRRFLMTVYLRSDTPDAANRARTVQQAPTDAGPTLGRFS